MGKMSQLSLHQPLKFFSFTLAIASCLNFINSDAAMAQVQNSRILTVTGNGIEKIATSLTNVQLGVEVSGKDATIVQQEVAQRSSQLVDFLRSRNVNQLKTTGIQLQPNYDYSDRQRRLVGYIGRNMVSFQIKTEDIGSLIDEAVNQGATRINGVSFTASEPAIAIAQKEALRLATQDAQQQAEAVLNALNFSAKEIVGIQINGAAPPQPRIMRSQTARNADIAESPIVGGEQEVRASVTLEIQY